jgi:cell division protein FtsI (penicillin-binding protein 3)
VADPTRVTTTWPATLRRRLTVVAILLAAWAAGIEARLVQLQVFERDLRQAQADRQQYFTIPAPGKRGDILDRHGNVLASSVDVDSVFAVPSQIRDPNGTAAAVCAALGDCTPAERARLAAAFSKPSNYARVRREVSPEEAARLAALNLRGIEFLKVDRRFYPNRELAAHVLGYVGPDDRDVDNKGLAGVESTYDGRIRGRNGTVLVQVDGSRRAFDRVEQPPTVGATLELTIDEYLQYFVERELHAGIAENRAESGCVVVMDPATGEILALANEPSFNPNAFRRADLAAKRNRAVQDLYEPGSTFKVVTASAAFEEKAVSPDDLIDVSAGMFAIGSRVIHDDHRHGVLSFTDVLVLSSNVGAAKVGLGLGAERLIRYVKRFGFGTRTSPDFPAETAGKVWDATRLSDSALASVAMGYQIGVTPLQMAAAVSSIANGGDLVEPRVVRAFIANGRREEVPRRVVRRTVTPATAATLTGIMEEVVERGTGTAAKIDGYTVAAKTGTAQRLIDGRYSKTEYNASFIAFVPSRKPALAVVVLINSPHGKRGIYGGSVAAPIFKRIAEEALRHLGVPRTVNPPPALLVSRDPVNVVLPSRPAGPPAPVSVIAAAASDGPADAVVPDLLGLGARDALRALTRAGLTGHCHLRGDGVVVDQDPAPGTAVDLGVPCLLRLARFPSPIAAGGRQ